MECVSGLGHWLLTTRRDRPTTGLFDEIDGWLDRDPDEFSASYEPEWGYPKRISVDPDTGTEDDGSILEIDCFQAVDSDEQLESACPVDFD